MVNDNNIKFEDLLSDNGVFDEPSVVFALHPLVTIQKETNKIFLRNIKLTARQKILVYALGKKLLKYKNLIGSETITALEVFNWGDMPRGTVDVAFKQLREERILMGKIKYEIPSFQVANVIKILNTNKK